MSSEAASSPVLLRSEASAVTVPGAISMRAYWRLFFFVLFLAALYFPALSAWLLPEEHDINQYFSPGYRLPKFNRFMALALYALSVDLIWGYTGLLSLGQGLYFGIGGYLVGYSLLLQKAALNEDKPRFIFDPTTELPPFMFQNRLTEVPSWISPLIDIWLALGLAVLLPMVIAAAFGYVVFQRKIKGVYFSLITQAVVYAMYLLVTNQMPYTGGEGGLYNLAPMELAGRDFKAALPMYLLITTIVVVFALACYALVHSKMGKLLTAIRDNEFRVMALGYNTAMYKTFIYALAGFMAGLAGFLFVASNRTAGPTFFSPIESIEIVIFVAVGGRGTLVGPILGAILVSEGKDIINEKFRDYWPIILGGIFIGVVLFLPEGIVGGVPRLFNFIRTWFYRRPGLTSRWNALRVGIGLMYWGIVLLAVGVSLRVIISFIKTPDGDAGDPATEEVTRSVLEWVLYGFGNGLTWSLLTGTLIFGSIMTVVGQCLCWLGPLETPKRTFVYVSIFCLLAFVVGGYLLLGTPLVDLRRLFGLGGFADADNNAVLGPIALALAAAAVLSWLFFALYMRGLALLHQNETTAKSVWRFILLLAIFVAANVFLNSVSDSIWKVPDHPLFGRLLMASSLAYITAMLALTVWFLRLLYQTHEDINRPTAVG
jgi:urea transport system permease protein